MSAWYSSFEAEGPYDEDVDALVVYLRRVVLEERDIEKATSVAEWLKWIIDEGAEEAAQIKDDKEDCGNTSFTLAPQESMEKSDSGAHSGWNKALQTVRDGIDGAARKRGLPPIEFSWV
jgi:DNA repair protein REV1